MTFPFILISSRCFGDWKSSTRIVFLCSALGIYFSPIVFFFLFHLKMLSKHWFSALEETLNQALASVCRENRWVCVCVCVHAHASVYDLFKSNIHFGCELSRFQVTFEPVNCKNDNLLREKRTACSDGSLAVVKVPIHVKKKSKTRDIIKFWLSLEWKISLC